MQRDLSHPVTSQGTIQIYFSFLCVFFVQLYQMKSNKNNTALCTSVG